MATTKKTATTTKRATTKRPAAKAKAGFSAEEKAAMKAASRERRKPTGEADLLAAIAKMTDDEQAIATRLHEIVMKAAPELEPKTWYGMPAWARDGKVVCFFQNAGKFKARYSTFGFQDTANLDAGSIWPTSFAITKLTKTGETEVRRLVKQAVS
ncbi:MAG: DUF1801 domain-containing protein [Thermoleophilia bacterium]|nr:DUF1801 domain-containing protein [Thermoleophilia bacterium]